MSTTYTAITSEGGLIPLDLLDEIGDGLAQFQQAADFGLDGRLSDEIQSAFTVARSYWEIFRHRRERTAGSQATNTRDWVGELLKTLGYRDLTRAAAHGRLWPAKNSTTRSLAEKSRDNPPICSTSRY